MRAWLNPQKIAERGLTPQEVVAAIQRQNVQVAAGVIGGPPYASGVELQCRSTCRAACRMPSSSAP